MILPRQVVLGLFVGALGAATSRAQLATPEVRTLPGGRVEVVNRGPSRWTGTNGWRLELERTITPPDGSEGMLARPKQLAIASDGRIAVSDWEGKGILLFGADGRFVRKIGRDGMGPGEFRPPIDIDIHGDTIAGFAPNISRSLAWRLDGTFLSQWRSASCCSAGAMILDAKGRQLVPTWFRLANTDRYAMVRYRLDGTPVDIILLPPPDPRNPGWASANGGMYGIPFQPWRTGVFDSRLRYIHGLPSTYTLIIAPHGDDTSRVIHMPGSRARIPDKLRDSLYQQYKKTPAIANVVKLEDIPAEQPYFTAIHRDESDNLWIDRPGPDGKTVVFDVVDAEGRYLGSVAAPAGSTREAVWRNGRMYRFGENADGAPVIEVFRVNRGSH